MIKNKGLFFSIALSAVIVVSFIGWRYAQVDPSQARQVAPMFAEDKRIYVHDKLLKLELTETDLERQQGLSDRLSMQDDEGMVFSMGNVDIHSFWMYHMHFPIDMIWLKDGVVVEIAPRMLPPDVTAGIPMVHQPGVVSDTVLELTADGAERYGIHVGESIDI